MARLASIAVGRTLERLGGSQGLAAQLTALGTELALGPEQILAQQVRPEIAERTGRVAYPAVYVYCERATNSLKEKFRPISAKLQMVAEWRVSSDRSESLGEQMMQGAEAITLLLDKSRGDWGEGVFYAGGYEVSYGPIRAGGRNFLQEAKVSFVLEMSGQ